MLTAAPSSVVVQPADGAGEPVSLRHPAMLVSALFSPDGTRVVTAAWDGKARVWRSDGAGEPVVLDGQPLSLTSAVFSPDGARVVTTSTDGSARVWPADGAGEPIVLRGHADQMHSAAFSPDGEQVVTTSADGTVRRWSVAPVAATQAALWRATSHCLSRDRREALLGETDAEADERLAACAAAVAAYAADGAYR